MVYSTRRFVLCLTLCHFVLVFFSPFSIAITSLGEERANLSAFRTFDRFVLVWICRFLFLLVSGKGCGLWSWHSLDFSLTFFLKEVSAGYAFIWIRCKREEWREAGIGFAIKSHIVSKQLSGLPKGINDRLMTLWLPLSGKRHATF